MHDSSDSPQPHEDALAPVVEEGIAAAIDVPAAPDALAGIPEPLANAMRRRGFEALTSVQQAVLQAESDDRDLRVSSQTGSGKTVAIGLALARHLSTPARRGPLVLALVPTRELAMQVSSELRWLFAGLRGIRVEVVMGGTSLSLERRALSGKPTVVVGTPGRVLDHLKTGALLSEDIEHVVLDESDRMLDMGFREELEGILELMPKERRTHLVSATFPAGVRKLADRFQRDALHIEGTRLGAANSDIRHIAHVVGGRECYAALVNHLLLLDEGARCLIFVERRIDATGLAARLSSDGFPVQPFSGELPQAQRTRTLDAFRAGTTRTLVSTDVAARGIDVPDIEMVIHFDMPTDSDTYVHRSGRTGRAGRPGNSVLLVPPRSRARIERTLRHARIESEWRPAPGASKVRKELRRRFRAQLHERLRSADGSAQKQLDYAKELLDGQDPAQVAAVLLELAQPSPPREPMEIREPSEREFREAPTKQRGRGSRGSAQGYVRFSINWGEQSGAAANRLMSHVCRRGQIKSNLIGTIEIGEHESTFEVDAASATRFEQVARKPDRREPHLRITRAGNGSSARPQGRHYRGGNDTQRERPGGKGKPAWARSSGKPGAKKPGATAAESGGRARPKARKPFKRDRNAPS